MAQYSYRKSQIFAILALILCAIGANAQYGQRSEPVFRGTAVLESGYEGWRLVPVCIYSSGKFYDADFYQSTPVPMSLINGTIYEVQRSGQAVGNFYVNDALRVGAVWYGRGNYKDFADTAKVQERAKATVQVKDASPDDRPTLKRAAPPEQAAPQAPKRNDTQIANNDPDRPVLKRGTQAPAPSEAGPKEDPTAMAERLRRARDLRAAVSDASTRATRPFDYHMDDEQQKNFTESMSKLAAAELAKVARARGITLAPKDKIDFADKSLRAYDVDYSNNAQLVFTAKFIPSMHQLSGLSEKSGNDVMKGSVYVTVVGRVNYNGEIERIFASVSDPRDLDTYPRLEIVDAVDVDSDTRAELLFAKLTDKGRQFVVYRLYGLAMNELFTSGVR